VSAAQADPAPYAELAAQIRPALLRLNRRIRLANKIADQYRCPPRSFSAVVP